MILAVIYVIIFLTGVAGNVSTCLVICRNAYLHTATNFYLLSLAVSDLLTLVVGQYKFLIEKWHVSISL